MPNGEQLCTSLPPAQAWPHKCPVLLNQGLKNQFSPGAKKGKRSLFAPRCSCGDFGELMGIFSSVRGQNWHQEEFLDTPGMYFLPPSSIQKLQKLGFSSSPFSCTKPLRIVFSKVILFFFFCIRNGYSKLSQEKRNENTFIT